MFDKIQFYLKKKSKIIFKNTLFFFYLKIIFIDVDTLIWLSRNSWNHFFRTICVPVEVLTFMVWCLADPKFAGILTPDVMLKKDMRHGMASLFYAMSVVKKTDWLYGSCHLHNFNLYSKYNNQSFCRYGWNQGCRPTSAPVEVMVSSWRNMWRYHP